MSDGPETSIQLAFCAFLQAGNLGFPIAWPFTVFSPISGVAFFDARGMLRAAPRGIGLAFTDSMLRTGIFQVDSVTPTDQGEAPGLRMAELVAVLFDQGTFFVAGNRWKVRINQVPKIAPAVMDAPWLRFPVSILYSVST